MFQGSFKGVSRTLRKFHECFETVSRKFKAYQKSFKKALLLLLLSLSSQLPEQKEGLFDLGVTMTIPTLYGPILSCVVLYGL